MKPLNPLLSSRYPNNFSTSRSFSYGQLKYLNSPIPQDGFGNTTAIVLDTFLQATLHKNRPNCSEGILLIGGTKESYHPAEKENFELLSKMLPNGSVVALLKTQDNSGGHSEYERAKSWYLRALNPPKMEILAGWTWSEIVDHLKHLIQAVKTEEVQE